MQAWRLSQLWFQLMVSRIGGRAIYVTASPSRSVAIPHQHRVVIPHWRHQPSAWDIEPWVLRTAALSKICPNGGASLIRRQIRIL